MASEPSNATTMSDLMLRVAEKLGIAEYTSTGQIHIPVDQYNFNLCKRYINNGIRMFMADSPVKGWRWMRRLMTVTFDAEGDGDDNINTDAARYKLAENFGGTVDGPIKYDADTAVGTRIDWCDESVIRARRSLSVNTGIPTLAAIRPYQPTSEALSATRQWEMIVDPAPGSAYVVKFPYTLHFDSMKMESGIATEAGAAYIADNTRSEVNGFFTDWVLTVVNGTGVGETATITNYLGAGGEFHFTALSLGTTPDTTTEYIVQPAGNLHPAGHQFDDAVEAACLARTEMESQDEHFDTFWSDYYHKKAIPNAFKVDQRSAPRKLGLMIGGPSIRVSRLGDSANFTYLDSDGVDQVQP
ncbi:hypothetical protein KAR91_78820 [Candidatus Pacearchaeota archaeon]|nr:hypothetical protein [Candidatus Pacearchaeota archaeon]